MNKNKQTPMRMAVPKPRNGVFALLRDRLIRSNAGGAHQGPGRQHQRQERDLADRIREVGEW